MALKKSELYSSLWASCDDVLRGGFEISCQACSSSIKTLASFKSRVSKPSVNQP